MARVVLWTKGSSFNLWESEPILPCKILSIKTKQSSRTGKLSPLEAGNPSRYTKGNSYLWQPGVRRSSVCSSSDDSARVARQSGNEALLQRDMLPFLSISVIPVVTKCYPLALREDIRREVDSANEPPTKKVSGNLQGAIWSDG